jgi:hypothetical protein
MAVSEESPVVTITKDEYDALVNAANILEKLEAAGVDNWEGYEYAFE